MSGKRYLGCSFPVLAGIVILMLILLLVGFLAGPVGSKMVLAVGKLFNESFTLPPWLSALSAISVDKPHPTLPPEAVFHIGSFPITNTVIAAWLTVIVLVLLTYFATRRMKLVPRGIQKLIEYAIDSLLSLCNSIAGEKNGRRFLPVVATIFLFVLFNAWLSLLPGFGSITVTGHEGHAVHLLRGANTDINMPLALAIVSFIAVEFYGVKLLGSRLYLSKFLNFGRFFQGMRHLFTGKMKSGISEVFSGVIDIFVGILEAFSELIRLVSFTFRLFGNMTAGEILLLIVVFLAPWVIVEIFFVLEIFIGLIQALIFSTLTLVFLTMATSHGNAESEHGED